MEGHIKEINKANSNMTIQKYFENFTINEKICQNFLHIAKFTIPSSTTQNVRHQ